MLGEGGSRGATLEMCLSKLLHAAPNCQIIAMSATLSNIDDLSRFLRAHIYSSDFRPVGRILLLVTVMYLVVGTYRKLVSWHNWLYECV